MFCWWALDVLNLMCMDLYLIMIVMSMSNLISWDLPLNCLLGFVSTLKSLLPLYITLFIIAFMIFFLGFLIFFLVWFFFMDFSLMVFISNELIYRCLLNYYFASECWNLPWLVFYAVLLLYAIFYLIFLCMYCDDLQWRFLICVLIILLLTAWMS
jgi:hypothetical protein